MSGAEQGSGIDGFMESGGGRIHYRLDGPARAPMVVLSNSLGTNLSMWDPQVPALTKKFRVLRYDTRGHGQSSIEPKPYSIAGLGQDVIGLLDGLKIGRAYFCGLSMGGMIGMWLGTNAGGRIKRLVLCNTAARIGTAETWNSRITAARTQGMAALTAGVLERWFTPEFAAKSPEAIERTRQMLLASPPKGYALCCEAIRDMDQRETIAQIRTPTLVIVGAQDPSTPPQEGRFIAEQIPGARCEELAAAHMSNIEAAERFTETVVEFLSEGGAN